MRRVGPLGQADGTPFVDADPQTGDQGSAVPAAAFNVLIEELNHLIEYVGLPPSGDDSDLTQIRQAVEIIAGSAGNQVTQILTGGATSHTLTITEQGVIWVHLPPGSADPHSIILPEAFTARAYTFVRTDQEAAPVTIIASGDDTIDIINTSFDLPIQQSSGLVAVADGQWATQFRQTPPATPNDVLEASSDTKSVTPNALAALWAKGADLSVPANGLVNPGAAAFFNLTSNGNPMTGFDPAVISVSGRHIVFRCMDELTIQENANLITNIGDVTYPDQTVITWRLVSDDVWVLASSNGITANAADIYYVPTNPLTLFNIQDALDQAATFLPTAWVKFDGTSLEILNGYNIASVTRSGTGKFRITFRTSFENNNYIVSGHLHHRSVSTLINSLAGENASINQTTTYIEIQTWYYTSSPSTTIGFLLFSLGGNNDFNLD